MRLSLACRVLLCARDGAELERAAASRSCSSPEREPAWQRLGATVRSG
jgi:hypothetical protein